MTDANTIYIGIGVAAVAAAGGAFGRNLIDRMFDRQNGNGNGNGKKLDVRKCISEKLYFKDGTTIYLPRTEFERTHQKCSETQCKKLDKLDARLNAMDEARSDALKDRHKKELWLAESVKSIADKVGATVEGMPKI